METLEATPIKDRMILEFQRGEFAYWPAEAEAKWRAEAPPKPRPMELQPGCRFTSMPEVKPCHYDMDQDSEFNYWQNVLEAGRSYMVGKDVSMDYYLFHHRSVLTPWQKAAYRWALDNRYYKLQIETPNREWEIYARGQYVMIALPHQDSGGERHYVTHDGKTKILVNVD